MRRLTVSHVSRWPPAKRRNYKTYIVKLIVMFTAPALTHNPRWKSFHLEIWDISLLYTHFSLLFLALGSESHLFLPFGGWQVFECHGKVRTHTSNKQTTFLLSFFLTVKPTMLGVVASVSKRLKVWPFSNITQQHATGCANGRNMYHPTMLHPFARS